MKTKKFFLLMVAIVASAVVFFTSCIASKEVAKISPAKSNPASKWEKALKGVGDRYVRFMDFTMIDVFEGISKEMVTSNLPFDTIFAKKMEVAADSIQNLATDYYKYNDSLKVATADQPNRLYKSFELNPDSAKQPRTKEFLTETTRKNFNQVIGETFIIGDQNFTLLRGEPLTPEKKERLQVLMQQYNTVAGSDIVKKIQEMYLNDLNLPVDKPFYTATEAREFRIHYAKITQLAWLWNRILESRLKENR